jgi:hypothetical protein
MKKLNIKKHVSAHDLQYNAKTKTFKLFLDDVYNIDDINRHELNIYNEKTGNEKIFRYDWMVGAYVSECGIKLIKGWRK